MLAAAAAAAAAVAAAAASGTCGIRHEKGKKRRTNMNAKIVF